MRSVLLLLATAILILPACGTDEQGVRGAAVPAEPSSIVSKPEAARLYEGNGLVCDDGASGPKLWLGGVPLMLGPPQCGGISLVNWDWQAVEEKERADETTWGSYHVVGRFDGMTIAVTEVGPYEDDLAAFGTEPDTSSPCHEPEGGWVVPDPAHATQNDVGAAAAYASSRPDYVASWTTHLEPGRLEFGPVIFNVLFTGHRRRHEAEIRKVWDGPLCVVSRDVPTARELARIRKEVEARLGEVGVEMLWSAGPAVEPVVEIGVVADVGGKAQAAFDARYGPGVVRLLPALTQVS